MYVHFSIFPLFLILRAPTYPGPFLLNGFVYVFVETKHDQAKDQLLSLAVDAQILVDAHNFTMDLPKLLEGGLHGRIKPMITHCTLLHLRTLPDAISKPILKLTREKCELRRCGHHELDEPLSTVDCILDCVDSKHHERSDGTAGTNKHRYIVATQDVEARRRLREIPGTPLLYVRRSVLIMEPMAQGSIDAQEREERGKFRAGIKGRRELKRKRDEDANDREESTTEGKENALEEQDVLRTKKKKGPKGPNPLSMLKPKKRAVTENGQKKESNVTNNGPPVNHGSPSDGAGEQPKKKRKRKHKSGQPSKVEGGSPEVSVRV